MYRYMLLQVLATATLAGLFAYVVWRFGFLQWLWQRLVQAKTAERAGVIVLLLAVITLLYATRPYPLHFALPVMMQSYAPGHLPASIPVPKVIEFFRTAQQFEQVEHIGADPAVVPAPIDRTEPQTVSLSLTAKEVISEVASGVYFNYWTYDGQVPGPLLRVRQGDTVQLLLTNNPTSLHDHNIDLHAVTGPGGGATLTQVAPGETKSFQWKALNPGLYVYHCASANVSTHNSHGQYGMILVEPEDGLTPVDHEFYLMQGELYTVGKLGKKGLVPFDPAALLAGNPNYVTFNGSVETTPRMKVQRGDTVRIFVGNGGVNLISSFHIIGEIFDTVYPEGAIGSAPLKNVQTTAVLPGGAAIVEFTADVAGNFIAVDHALARMNKGAWAVMVVDGEANPDVFGPLQQ